MIKNFTFDFVLSRSSKILGKNGYKCAEQTGEQFSVQLEEEMARMTEYAGFRKQLSRDTVYLLSQGRILLL